MIWYFFDYFIMKWGNKVNKKLNIGRVKSFMLL